ncbi:MAG: cytochrome c-type biogenesis protein CcmH [Acidimicrobiia bacterium]|nr:cytochrome c-type biogenesis protein CcmH [Acidimicrobiia bacterium]MYC86211.1 cytochrome c-type biogenesis protein CcmH [Acidimicrobiia bacterium]
MADRRAIMAGAATLILAGIVGWGLGVGEPSDQDRVEALGARIRCPVCQGESIVDSPTPYANDILAFVEEKVDEGWSDEQILDYLEARFEGIRLDPRFSGTTVLLWVLPAGVAVAGAWLAARRLIRRAEPADG